MQKIMDLFVEVLRRDAILYSDYFGAFHDIPSSFINRTYVRGKEHESDIILRLVETGAYHSVLCLMRSLISQSCVRCFKPDVHNIDNVSTEEVVKYFKNIKSWVSSLEEGDNNAQDQLQEEDNKR